MGLKTRCGLLKLFDAHDTEEKLAAGMAHQHFQNRAEDSEVDRFRWPFLQGLNYVERKRTNWKLCADYSREASKC